MKFGNTHIHVNITNISISFMFREVYISGLHTTSSYRYQVGYQVPMVSIIKQIFYLVSHLIECAPGGLSSLYLRGLSIQFLKVFASFSLVYCFTLTTPCLNNFSITKYIIAFNYANVVAINLLFFFTFSHM